jgi:nucleoside-diphosphate-sugar epimerase
MNTPENATPARVFITGAAGFIGRALASRYRSLGAEVRGMDVVADPAGNVVAGDLRSPEAWRSQLSGMDLVIHTAALVSTTASMREAWDVNCNGTRRLLTACREAGVRRFIQLSSIAAFGFDFPDGADESWPLITDGNSYVDTKITSEHAVLAAHAAGELECTIIRPGDVYGPGSRPWIVIPLEMMRSRQFLLPDGGRGVFSPVYIDDLGQVFTLTSGVGVSCAGFFGYHWRWLGRSGAPPSLPRPLAVVLAEAGGTIARRLGLPSELGRGAIGMLSRSGTYSIDKARRLLGYEPRVDLDRGMVLSEAWAREQGLIS